MTAPPVTREWPAGEAPSHSPSHASHNAPVILSILVLVAATVTALALDPGARNALLLTVGDPLEFLVLSAAAGLLVSLLADWMVERWGDAPPRRALLRGMRAVARGDEPRGVARRLRGVELPGRTGLYRDVAARCMERAGECGGLEGRLTREGRRWLRKAIRETYREDR